ARALEGQYRAVERHAVAAKAIEHVRRTGVVDEQGSALIDGEGAGADGNATGVVQLQCAHGDDRLSCVSICRLENQAAGANLCQGVPAAAANYTRHGNVV